MADISTTASPGAIGRRTSLVRRPSGRSRFEAVIKALLFGAATVSIATTLAIVFSLLQETIAFFGDVPVGDYLFGTKWTPQFAGDQGGFGYFGFSYYESAADKLNLVGVDSGDGNCVKPSVETIQDGSYKPLSRPLFMYPSAKAMKRPEVKAFMEFVVAQAPEIAEAAKIVPLTAKQTALAKDELAKAEA